MEFSTGTWLVMGGVWVIIGLGLSLAAGSIWKGYRPYGAAADHAAAVISAIIVGIVDMLVIPIVIDVDKIIVFLGAILEPAATVLIVLWILRKIKPQKED